MRNQSSEDQKKLVPRGNLQRTLKYRPQVRYAYYLVILMTIVMVASTLVVAAQYVKTGLSAEMGVVVANLILATFMFLQGKLILKPLAFSVIDVFPDRLEIDRIGKKLVIPFETISKVQFTYLPYLGGGFTVTLASKKKFRFTVVLERSEYILEAISAFNPDLIPLKEMETFRRTAIVSDHGGAYADEKLKNKKALFLKFVVEPWGAAFFLVILSKFMGNSVGAKHVFGLGLVLFGIQLIISGAVLVIISAIVGARTRANLIKNPNQVSRDIAFENRIDAKSRVIQRILALLIFLGIALLIVLKARA